MMLENIFIIVSGYCLGSIPFAYLIAKRVAGIDLKLEGSGNIGARNAYEVTERRWVGIVVLVLDLLKGAIPVLILERSAFTNLVPVFAVAIVLGHCYPVWLKFHGGRGLATTAGILLCICPAFLILWLVLYWSMGRFYKDVHVDTLIAVLLVGAAAILTPANLIARFTLDFSGQSVQAVRICIGAIALVIASRHVDPVRKHFSARRF